MGGFEGSQLLVMLHGLGLWELEGFGEVGEFVGSQLSMILLGLGLWEEVVRGRYSAPAVVPSLSSLYPVCSTLSP